MFQNFLPSYSVSTTNSTHHYQNLTLNFDHLYTPPPIVKPATGCMAEGPIHKGSLEACFALPPPLENVENFKCLRCIFSNLTQKTHELHNSECSRHKVQFPNCSCQFLKFIFHVQPQTSALWWNQFLLARLACPLHDMGFACHALNTYTRLL